MKIRYIVTYIVAIIDIVFMTSCSTLSTNEIGTMEDICKMIISRPDTLLILSSDTSVWFVNPHNIKNKEQNDIAEKVTYIKRWFKDNYTLDTTHLYTNNYPFNYGKYTQRVKIKIFRLEYKSNESEVVENTTENRYLCFEFFQVNNKWLLNNIGIYSLLQLQRKFREPPVDIIDESPPKK